MKRTNQELRDAFATANAAVSSSEDGNVKRLSVGADFIFDVVQELIILRGRMENIRREVNG